MNRYKRSLFNKKEEQNNRPKIKEENRLMRQRELNSRKRLNNNKREKYKKKENDSNKLLFDKNKLSKVRKDKNNNKPKS